VTSLVRNLDLVLLGVALPVFVAADLPLVAWITAAAVWLAWRGIGEWTDRKAESIGSSNPGRFAGLVTGSLIGRGWMLAIALFLVGTLTDNRTGLAATVLCIVLFTSFFVVRLASRPTHQAGVTS
jgi:Na+/citrate or Na+/malate symporter